MSDERTAKLLDVRGSFLHVFEPQENTNDDGTKRHTFNGAFMIPKDSPYCERNLKVCKKLGAAAKKAKWGDDPEKWPSIASHKVFIRDGDNPDHYDPKKRPEYKGHYIVTCNNQVDDPPQILTNRKDDDGDWIPAVRGQKGAPYAGCYCNVVISSWGQDNKHGQRINAQLDVIQFRRDGEAFTQKAPVNANDYLDEDDVSYEGDMDDDSGYGDDDGGLI